MYLHHYGKPTIHNIDATLFKVIAISVYQFGSCMPNKGERRKENDTT